MFLNLIPGFEMGLLFFEHESGRTGSGDRKACWVCRGHVYIFMHSLGPGIGVAIGGVVFRSQFVVELCKYPELARNATALAQDASGADVGRHGRAGVCGPCAGSRNKKVRFECGGRRWKRARYIKHLLYASLEIMPIKFRHVNFIRVKTP